MRRRSGGEESWLLSYADLITNLLLFFVVLLTAANLSKGRMQQIAKSLSGAEQPASLESIRKEIDQRIADQQLKDLVSTTVTNDGLEISLNSGLVFDSGKAAVRPEMETVVTSMLKTLEPYGKRYSFAVEGRRLVQRFPLYRPGDANASPGGGTRALFYRLAPGEAGWQLVLDKAEDTPPARGAPIPSVVAES